MADSFVEAFVDKLILLEQTAGAQVHYRVMPPLTVPFQDSVAIQSVAKKITEFIGLAGFTFIIAITKQKKNVAGHIDLSTGGKEVFVEVDSEMMKFPDAVAATLCHEACHKWLQINCIESPVESDNEILTDITSVFLGLGKIMLNGCKTANVREEKTPNGTSTFTETMTAGYLDRDQLAFVYRLVCAMRSISTSDLMEGLNAEASLAVNGCGSLYANHYDPSLHQMETMQGRIAGFESRVVEVQRTMADLHKHVTYIKRGLCDTADEYLSAGYRKLESLRKKAVAITQESVPDPALRFLRAIKTECEVKRLEYDIDTVSKGTEGLLRPARMMGHNLNQSSQRFPPPSSAMFSILTCPQDGTKLKLPENSGDLIARCPTCKYRFAYNTNALSFPEKSAPPRLGWWAKFRSLMVKNRTA
jgi:hypothetical protein